MKTPFVLCLIFSIAANCQQFALANKLLKYVTIYPDTSNKKANKYPRTGGGDSLNNLLPCKGNGVITFVDSSSQPLWLYYWYAEDVENASHECQIRRFWKQLDAGNNQFTIPRNKTLIFRICISTECLNSVVKQYGIVNYCNADNGTVIVN
jgi:hypothetical protein